MTDEQRYLSEIRMGLTLIFQKHPTTGDIKNDVSNLMAQYYKADEAFDKIPEGKTTVDAATEILLAISDSVLGLDVEWPAWAKGAKNPSRHAK